MNNILLLLLALSLAGCTAASQPPPQKLQPEAPPSPAAAPPVPPAALPPAAEAVHGYPPLPEPATPLPTPPYTDELPHPVEAKTIPESIITAATAEIVKKYPSFAPFTVSNAWFINPELTLAAGNLANGRPGLIRIPREGDPGYAGIPVVGAPGPAYIKGVKGDWVLIAQGLGYQVYNYKTGELDRSDETATPIHKR